MALSLHNRSMSIDPNFALQRQRKFSSNSNFQALCRTLMLLLFAVLLPNSVLAGQAEGSCPVVQPDSDAAYFEPQQALLRDPTGTLNLNDVAAPDRATDFVPTNGQLSAGYTSDTLWLRFCLPPDTHGTQPRWLRIAPPLLDDLALYLPKDGGYTTQQVGDHHAFSGRAWSYRLFAMPVANNIDVSRPVYLRIRTTSAVNMHIDLWTEAAFQRLVVLDSAFYGLLSGAVILLGIFSLISWRWLRYRTYLYYGANVMAGGFFLLMNAGFGSQFLYPDSAVMNDKFIAWFTGPILAIHVLFFTYLFAVRLHLPRAHPFMLLLAGLYVLLTPLSLFTDWRNIGLLLQYLAFPVTMVWMLLVAYLGFKDKDRRIYMLAFLPWLIGLFANSAVRLGTIPNHFLINYSGELTALIHLVVLPVLLIRRTRRAEQEKDDALARELAEAHRSERELEGRVAERTEELQQEVNARGKLQEQLKAALATERATLANQRQFVAMLSHEFRTPLAIIDTTAQRLDMRLEETQPDLIPRIDKIRRAVRRMLNLLENCLSTERLNSTGTKLKLEDMDLRAYLRDHLSEQTLADTQRIRLELPDAPVPVRCDRHLFEVALSNLVDNALKYSPEGYPVLVRLIPAGITNAAPGMVAIEVRDQGSGIRPEDRDRIFEKFFRSEGLARIPGAGLGLHLAQVLARRHGGDLHLNPAVVGEGASFVMTLPASLTP